MSPENCGVFQLMKEVTFLMIQTVFTTLYSYIKQDGMLIHNQGIFLDGKVADLV